ncbi:hypothetical protein DYB28_015762, partial [Aphanomyces astaci]
MWEVFEASAAACQVLLGSGIPTSIYSYQDGVYEDLLPFSHLLVQTFAHSVVPFHEKFYPWFASRGDYGLVQLLRCRPQSLPYLMRYAAWSGDMDLLLCLHAKGDLLSLANLLDIASSRGHLDLLVWLHEH